jgi:tyrosine-protein phosphatase SIW14
MRKSDVVVVCFIYIASVLLGGCATRPVSPPTRTWEQPCDVCVPGVANFTKVTDKLWRGSQPDMNDPDIFRKLEQRGVKTVINLRHNHDDFDKLKETNIRYLWIPMRAWHPEEEDLVLFLSALRRAFADPNLWPVFVHCAEGKDRTGYAIAAYRIIEEQWEAEDAIHEMFDFRYNTFWLGNPRFLRDLKKNSKEIAARVTRAP